MGGLSYRIDDTALGQIENGLHPNSPSPCGVGCLIPPTPSNIPQEMFSCCDTERQRKMEVIWLLESSSLTIDYDGTG